MKVSIPISEWCELCDTLQVSPDAPMDLIILKAKVFRDWFHRKPETTDQDVCPVCLEKEG